MVTASCAEVKSSSFVHMAIKDIGMEVAIKQLITASDELMNVSKLAGDFCMAVYHFLIVRRNYLLVLMKLKDESVS